MRLRLYLVIATVGAMLVLALGAATSSASNAFETTTRSTATSSRLVFVSGFVNVTCELTLLRTLSSRVTKVSGTVFGQITGININQRSCRNSFGGGATAIPLGTTCTLAEGAVRLCVVNSANFRLHYISFEGPLPSEIRTVTFYIERTEFLLLTFGEECLYTGQAFGLFNVERQEVTGGRALRASTILNRVTPPSGGLCSATASFEGTFSRPTLAVRLRLV